MEDHKAIIQLLIVIMISQFALLELNSVTDAKITLTSYFSKGSYIIIKLCYFLNGRFPSGGVYKGIRVTRC